MLCSETKGGVMREEVRRGAGWVSTMVASTFGAFESMDRARRDVAGREVTARQDHRPYPGCAHERRLA